MKRRQEREKLKINIRDKIALELYKYLEPTGALEVNEEEDEEIK